MVDALYTTSLSNHSYHPKKVVNKRTKRFFVLSIICKGKISFYVNKDQSLDEYFYMNLQYIVRENEKNGQNHDGDANT